MQLAVCLVPTLRRRLKVPLLALAPVLTTVGRRIERARMMHTCQHRLLVREVQPWQDKEALKFRATGIVVLSPLRGERTPDSECQLYRTNSLLGNQDRGNRDCVVSACNAATGEHTVSAGEM